MANTGTQSLPLDFGNSSVTTIMNANPNFLGNVEAIEHDLRSGWGRMCDLQDFKNPQVWMAGLIELWVTGLYVFTTGAVSITLGSQDNVTSPFLLPMIAGLLGALILPLCIFAALPASGGHINPLITLGSFAIRASSFPRCVIYIVGQIIGATVGASLLHVALGGKVIASAVIPGCTWNSKADIGLPQAFIFELITCVIFLWVAYVTGLDPRQGQSFGRVLGPMMVGLVLGICIFITGIVIPGYAGTSMNPARCLGLLATTGNFENHFVHWICALAAATISGLVYLGMPPYKPKLVIGDNIDDGPICV